MNTTDFDYDLPPGAIAQEAAARGLSRLLIVSSEGLLHRRFDDLGAALLPGDLLVVNDTRVVPARLQATTERGGRVELLLLEPRDALRWEALARPGRRLRAGRRLVLADGTAAVIEGREGDRFLVRFARPVADWLDRLGQVPLPPYIPRPATPADAERYHTVYARAPGAVAAPTAGLHFSLGQLADLETRGIARVAITLHVGRGTFSPITADQIEQHTMHRERFAIPEAAADSINAARRDGRRVVAVGTTVVRALESAALRAAATGCSEALAPGAGTTDLFIRPGFGFRVVDRLLTNFHLPRSSLLVLVAAFAGRERVLAAYREAIARGYRFYSYGDASLLERAASDC